MAWQPAYRMGMARPLSTFVHHLQDDHIFRIMRTAGPVFMAIVDILKSRLFRAEWRFARVPSFQGTYINSPGTTYNCPPAGGNPPSNTPTSTIDDSGLTAYTTLSAGSLTAYVSNKAGSTFFPVSYQGGGPGGVSGYYQAVDTNGNEITGNNGVYTDTTGNTATPH